MGLDHTQRSRFDGKLSQHQHSGSGIEIAAGSTATGHPGLKQAKGKHPSDCQALESLLVKHSGASEVFNPILHSAVGE